MDYNRLIHEYLDNEISQTDEKILFNELSKSNELREEFNSQLKLHLAAQNDIGTITPPIESTNMIFSSLGFNIPSGNYISNINPSHHSFWSKSFATIIFSLISALLTGSIVFLSVIEYNKNDKANFYANEINKAQSNNDVNKIPLSQSFDNTNNIAINEGNNDNALYSNNSIGNNHKHQNKSIISNNRKISKSLDNFNNNIIDKNKSQKDNIINSNSDLSINNIVNINQNNTTDIRANNDKKINTSNINDVLATTQYYNNLANNNSKNNLDYNYLNSSKFKIYNNFDEQNKINLPKDFTLNFRSLSSKSINEVNLPSSGTAIINNFGLSFSYKINENHSIGVEIGQEQYSQKFIRNLDGQSYLISQNPALIWYGVKYTLNLPELEMFNAVEPYFDLFAGGTISGPLFKSQLGLNYKIYDLISVHFGAEYSSLLYNVQNVIYNSDKFGFTYGIKLHY